MQLLKTLWPTPFKIEKLNVLSFIIQLIIFVVVCVVINWVAVLLSNVAIVGIIFRIIGYCMGAYSTIGVVLCVLCFLGILK